MTTTNDFQDVWLMNSSHKNPDGFTYGHDLDLLNDRENFLQRIDYVFVRNSEEVFLKHVKAMILGDEVKDKTPTGLWPSDHGGIAADLKFNTHKK